MVVNVLLIHFVETPRSYSPYGNVCPLIITLNQSCLQGLKIYSASVCRNQWTNCCSNEHILLNSIIIKLFRLENETIACAEYLPCSWYIYIYIYIYIYTYIHILISNSLASVTYSHYGISFLVEFQQNWNTWCKEDMIWISWMTVVLEYCHITLCVCHFICLPYRKLILHCYWGGSRIFHLQKVDVDTVNQNSGNAAWSHEIPSVTLENVTSASSTNMDWLQSQYGLIIAPLRFENG